MINRNPRILHANTWDKVGAAWAVHRDYYYGLLAYPIVRSKTYETLAGRTMFFPLGCEK
jgi:hypothetical protein